MIFFLNAICLNSKFFFQAVIQAAEAKNLLSVASPFLNAIFNGSTSMVLNTTVKEFLFDGIKICNGGRPRLPCTAIRLENPKTMVVEDDGTISIALFRHVSIFK